MPPMRLDLAAMYPRAKSSYHQFRWRQGERHNAVYERVQYRFAALKDHSRLELLNEGMKKMLTKREIYTCEVLRNNRHPNISKYRGVECKAAIELGEASNSLCMSLGTERVYKLVFKRYDGDLQDLDVKCCSRSIEAGILHMHSLGLCHMDIKPENVFVENLCVRDSSRRHESVIGDFDSTAPIGSRLDLKGGDMRWSNPRANEMGKAVEANNDWFNLQNLKLWLVKETGSRLQNYDGIGKKIAGATGPRLPHGGH